ncbi:MAG TPA: hypothetical protein VFL36_15820 [Myxococcales bacterium]|nr:hypothetical protein [Myxococcales bacterium]
MKNNAMLVLVLVLAAAACGGTQGQPAATAADAECAMTLAPGSDAEAVQNAVDAVAAGAVDPCAGSLAHRELYRALLERIDRSDDPNAFVTIVYRMQLLHPDWPLPREP